MKKLLVIRFSAIGDVAMTIPVIYACAVDNPQLQITVLSREFLSPLFSRMPANVTFKGVDLKKECYQGIKGLNRLYKELKKEKFDAVADFHDVLRSKYLRFRFMLSGKRVAHIDKGRKGKEKLVRTKHRIMKQQKSSFQRYREVLEHLGIHSSTHFTSIFPDGKGDLSQIVAFTGEKGNNRWVGIAPFAAHEEKTYSYDLQEQVIDMLDKLPDIRIFIFGAGKDQGGVAEIWEKMCPNTVIPVIDKLKMDEELILMSHLDVMLSMDSANMHLASLVNTPVVSIWGATHPYAGFMGWNQKEEDALQIDLPCRPCSIYGSKECIYPCTTEKHCQCMNLIKPETIVRQLKKYLN